jgi:hypothetical protein
MCAYPNGDHDANVVSAARSLGFMTGLTTITGHIEGSDDPMTLRRINVHQAATSTRAEFACRMIGLL